MKFAIHPPMQEIPPTGGAHCKPHRTAEIFSDARRRGGGVAPRVQRAAERVHTAGGPSDRPRGERHRSTAAHRSVPRADAGLGVGRRAKCPLRIPLGRRRSRPYRALCCGTGRSAARRDHGQQHARDRGAQTRHRHHPDRLRCRRRSGRRRLRRQSLAPRRQHHRLQQLRSGDRRQVGAVAERGGSDSDPRGAAVQPPHRARGRMAVRAPLRRGGRPIRWGGGAARAGAQRRGDSPRASGAGTDVGQRSRGHAGYLRRGERAGDHPVNGATPPARDLSVPALRCAGRSNVLRRRYGQSQRARGHLRRPYPQGREAGRSAGAGAGQIRAGDQPEDSTRPWDRGAAAAGSPRRRGDRMIGRRELITLLGGAAIAWPLVARAQSNRPRRVGVLMAMAPNDPEAQLRVKAFEAGLRELGWNEGGNLRLEYRWASDDATLLRKEAAELLELAPDLILATSTPVLTALRSAIRLPIVFVQVTDPVGGGFVPSLARPGGDLTGFTSFEFTIGSKCLEALKHVAPAVTRVALVFTPDTAAFAHLFWQPFEAVAPSFYVPP